MPPMGREELLVRFIVLVLMYIGRVHDNKTIKLHKKYSCRLWLSGLAPHYMLHCMVVSQLNCSAGGHFIFLHKKKSHCAL